MIVKIVKKRLSKTEQKKVGAKELFECYAQSVTNENISSFLAKRIFINNAQLESEPDALILDNVSGVRVDGETVSIFTTTLRVV